MIPRLSLLDRAILAAANLCIIVRHPRLARKFWRRGFGVPLFATPRTHGQLVHWRKFFDHNPLFVEMTDKLTAKQWAARRAPDVASPAVLWRGRRAEDIPDAFFAPGYVIKTNHGSGYNYFPGRETLTRQAFNERFNRLLARPYGRGDQWAYHGIVPEIFVEELVSKGAPLWEATFRCHDGAIASYYVAREQKTPNEQNAFFLPDGTRLPDPIGWKEGESFPADFVAPPFVEAAKAIASRLSAGLDYVRIDLMWDGTRIWFGEATLYPGSGYGAEARARIAPLIEANWRPRLHMTWFLTTPQPWPLSLYASAFRRWVEMEQASSLPRV